MDFAGKTVLVTGAARGIGLHLTSALLERGATVLALGRDAGALQRLVVGRDGRVLVLAADLSQAGEVDRVIKRVQAHHPETFALINNAAIMLHRDLTAGEAPGEIAEEIAVNLNAPLRLSVALLPGIARQGGAVVNVTSGLGLAPKPDAAVYSATKAALRSFTRSLRDQARARGLTVQVTDVVMTLVDTTLSRPGKLRKYPPDRAAHDLLCGVEAGLDEVWVERTRLLRLAHRVSPALAYRLMRAT